MRGKAIIRIIAWSGVAFLLTGLLAGALAMRGRLPLSYFGSSRGYHYDDANEYQVGAVSLAADQIRRLEVNWIAGAVDLQLYDGDVIMIEEESKTSLTEQEQLRYRLKDGQLTVQFCSPEAARSPFWKKLEKKLIIHVPRDNTAMLDTVSLNCVSADVRVDAVSAWEMEVASVSGNISLMRLNCEKLELEAVSGTVNLEEVTAKSTELEQVNGHSRLVGSFEKLEYSGVSGDVEIDSVIRPQKAEITTVSGAVTLRIPENEGFTASYSRVSGKVECDFPAIIEKNRIYYGERDAARFEIDTVSGRVRILKK